jgi:CheY-like chemotaxis protein
VLAHELRNPLAPIRHSLQILRMSTANDSSSDRMCEMMERQVDHMVRLVDDLMEVSRITRGAIELRKEETDLVSLMRSAVETSKPLMEANEHQLAISLPVDPVPIFGDSVRLAQVLSNLLNNAAKYTDRGGQIWLGAKREGTDIVVSVRDTGIGIPSDMLPVIFDMFMQVDRSTSRSQGGLGIGLTLVKTLVELHGGTITAQSDGPGQGSEFIVRLPVAVTKLSQDRIPSQNRITPELTVQRVLIVDDNQDSGASLGMLLKLLGADVRVVNAGAAALAAIEFNCPDVVLLDIGMPGMDGCEVARRIRKNPNYDHVVLIALTGWGQTEDRQRTQAAGFNHHLVKPADITDLRSILGSIAK